MRVARPSTFTAATLAAPRARADAVQSHVMEWHRDDYRISTDPALLDLGAIWGFLRTSYWAVGVPRAVIERSIENSLVFGLYGPWGEQAGFARAVTDRARFAWLGDVFVLDQHRGRGLGVWLVRSALAHPELAGVRVLLGTSDAHALYERFGFRPVDPARIMERRGRPDPGNNIEAVFHSR